MKLSDYRDVRTAVVSLKKSGNQSKWTPEKVHRELSRIMHTSFQETPTTTLPEFLKALDEGPNLPNWKDLVRMMVPSYFAAEDAKPQSTMAHRTPKYLKPDFPSDDAVRKIRLIAEEKSGTLLQLMKELEEKGADRKELEEALAMPFLRALDNNRNFNVGLTTADNNFLNAKQSEFREIWRRMDLSIKKIGGSDRDMARIKTAMVDTLREHLPHHLLKPAADMLRKSDINNILRIYKGALFYGMFESLLKLEYLDRHSPFKDDKAFLRHIITYVGPGIYLGTKAMDPEKHDWRKVILRLHKILALQIVKRAEIQKVIGKLLFYRFYNCFHTNDDERDLAAVTEKVRQIIRKIPPQKTQS